MDIYTGE